MLKFIKLAICGIPLGAWLSAVGYSIPYGPYLNSSLFIGGIAYLVAA